MRTPLLVGAALASLAAPALAQSTVTVFGIVDVGAQRLKNGDKSVTLQSIDGLQTSRLGFRGSEDLGGGLSASFHLEGALSPDDGTAGGFNFRRRSTVSLAGKALGELRLGRDYTPTFWSISNFSPFGTNGVGSAGNMVYGFDGLSSTASTIVRANNSVGYFLPGGLGGVYGQAMVAFGEGAPGKYQGLRVGFANEALDVAVATSKTENNAAGDKFRTSNIGASYKIGPAKLMGLWLTSKQTTRQQDNWLLGATVTLDLGELRASVIRSHYTNSANAADYHATQLALGYVYHLSKRSALYASASRIGNSSGAKFVIPGGPALGTGQSSKGIEAGIRHVF